MATLESSIKIETNYLYNDILYSICLVLHATEIFPEFIGADVTFVVNKQWCEMFLVSGVDRCNKVFVAFRCFIPSKLENTYAWTFNEAMSHLLSNEILKYNQCISADDELNINYSVQTLVHSFKLSFTNTKQDLTVFIFIKRLF